MKTGPQCSRRRYIPVFHPSSLYCLFLVVLLPVVHAADVGSQQRMLALTGMAGIVRTLPEQIHHQLHRPGAITNDATAGAVEQRLIATYNAMDVMAILNDYVASRLSSAQLDAILAWYDSPLGRRLARAERQAESAAGREDMQAFLAEFDRQPVSEERVRLVRRFEQVGRLSRINMAVMRALYETEIVAVNAQRPQQARLDERRLQEEIQRQFYNQRELILPGLAVNMMAASYYTLRSFDNGEIRNYIAFLESDSGRALLDLYESLPIYLLGQLIRRSGMPVPAGFFQLKGEG